ncbi:MAG: TonB-dependent receptor [Thermosynechococcaceae cyanobacterium]
MSSQSRHPRWVQVSLLGAIASTGLTFSPALANPNLQDTVEEKAPPAVVVEETLTTEPESVSAALPPTADTADKASPVGAANTVQILTPVPESLIGQTDSSVTVQSPVGQAIELRVNGALIDAGQIGQSITNPSTQQVQRTWYDLQFQAGTNRITVHNQGELVPLESAQVYSGSKPLPQEATAPSETQPFAIISPTPNELIGQPATSVTVQFPLGETVELRVNGSLVDNAQVGRTATDTTAGKVRQTWYGVTLQSGENTLTVNRPGETETLASVKAQVRGEPDKLKVTTLETKIPADGRSTATVQGQLLDKNNNRSNWTAVVTLQSTEGKFVGVDANPDAPGFQVQAVDGQFTATLQSNLQAGLVRVQVQSNALEGYHQLEFSTPLRADPLLTGVIDFRLGRRGTDFFDSFRDYLPKDQDNGFGVDLKASAFGIASIGEWSVTGAFNSERALNTDCNGNTSLFRAVGDCSDTLYPVYGDDSTTEVTAPSTDNFYLRFERTSPVKNAGTDYFMWGDYHTEEFNRSSQLFSATGRDLHGFKANYNIGNLQLTGLYGNNVEGFQRDTIAPDGTSGFYFLSRRLLVSGSEDLYLELEELNRPGTVLQRERLSRGADYDIDYDRGTILFRRPVLRTDVAADGTILVRRIVATYQFESNAGQTNVYGGRLQYNFSRALDQESWLGTTYFREDRGDQNFQLYGADAQIALGKDAQFVAEYAHSDNGLDGDRISGSAYRAELTGRLFDRLSGKAYFRATDTGFSNNATTSFVPGQTRYGAEVDAEITNSTSLRASYDHEDNVGIAPRPLDTLEELLLPGLSPTPGSAVDNSLTTIRAGLQQKIGKANLGVDWVHRDRNDRLTGDSTVSDQLSSSFTMPLAKNLNFHAYNDLTLSSESDPLYPNRTTVGLDWQIHPDISLSFDSTYLSGGQYDGDFIPSVGIKGQHTFATDTTLRGEATLLGDRGMGGRFGIDQGLKLAPGLNMDFSYEYVFSQQFRTAAGQQFSQPFAVGSGASALTLTNGHSFSTGISYTDNPNLQLGARVEHRVNERGSNTVISANVLGKVTRDLTALASFQQASASNQGLEGLGTSREVKLGLAYRNPTDDTFNGLLRYEYRQNPSTIPESLLLGQGTGSQEHLLSVEGIYAPSWNWELYGKFGVRHSETNLAQDLVGTSTVSLAQLRATHRFNYRWDVSAEARWIGQPSVGYNEFGLNAEVGYYLNPNLRLAAGYAFGDANDRDLGNSRSASGPYLGVTLKLDNNLFKDFGFQKPSAPQQQESLVKKPGEAPAEAANTAVEEPQAIVPAAKRIAAAQKSVNPVTQEEAL